MDKCDIAYSAGLLDGEGCIGINKTQHPTSVRPYYTLIVQIVNTDKRMIHWLKDTWNMGAAVVIPSKRVNHKPLWRFVVRARKARDFLEAVCPYLVIKGEQAEIGIEFQDSMDSNHVGQGRPLDKGQITNREKLHNRLMKMKI
jgi:hypothetical protein